MSSFGIADCPVRLNVSETQSGNERIQKGSLILTVRNKTERARAGQLSVQAQGAAKPEWFSFEGAPPTSPREIERYFKPSGTETIQVNVLVPGNVAPGSYLFNVRIVDEDSTGDFVVSPNVAFDVAAWTQPAPPSKERFPWWAIAVAVMLVLLIVGAAAWLLWPADDQQYRLSNAKTRKCLTIGSGAPADNGVHAVQYSCDRDPAQRWFLDKKGDDYLLKNFKTGKCLTVEGSSNLDNVPLIQSDCNDQRVQLWRIGDLTAPTTQIKNEESGKCITIAGGTATTNNLESVQYDCDQDLSRSWMIKAAPPPPAK